MEHTGRCWGADLDEQGNGIFCRCPGWKDSNLEDGK